MTKKSLRPNPLKKLIVDDDRLIFIIVNGWQIDMLLCAINLYKKFLGRIGKEDEIKLTDKFLEQFDIANTENLTDLIS